MTVSRFVDADDKSMRKLIPILILIVALAGNASAAASLLNYEHRVVRAAEQIERIRADLDYGDEAISYIKRLLPRSEQIHHEGGEVTVDNTWLYVMLDSYAAEKDSQQRKARLNDIAGRLHALDEHLRRAEEASTDSRNERDKIREILSRPAFQPEPETAIGRFVKEMLRKARGVVGRVMMGLQRLLEKIFGAGASTGWLSNVVLFIVLGAALLVGVMMARRIRVPRAKKKKKRIILGEEVSADSSSRELAEAGLAAARAGDLRSAVRKLYVSLLYELSERRLLELEDGATNHEYLRKVARFNALVAPMRYLTERFDYVWYGMYPSSQEEFSTYLSRYEEAMESARILGEQPALAS